MRFATTGVVMVVIPVGVAAFVGRLAPIGGPTRHQGPTIEVAASIDIGNCEVGRSRIGTFKVTNRGSAALVIDDVQTSCVCSDVERLIDGKAVAVKRLVLEPFEEATLSVRVTARGPAGQPQHNLLRLHTNDQSNKVVTVDAVIPLVTGGITTIPNVVDFGELPLGGTARCEVEVWDYAATPHVIDRVESTAGGQVSVSRSEGRHPSGGTPTGLGTLIGRINVLINGGVSCTHNSEVLVFLSNDASHIVRIPVLGRVVPPVIATPSSLMLPRRSADGLVLDGACIIKSVAGDTLEVEPMSVPEGLKIAVEPIEGNRSMIKLVVRLPKDLLGVHRKVQRVILTTRAGGHEVPLTIPVLIQDAE